MRPIRPRSRVLVAAAGLGTALAAGCGGSPSSDTAAADTAGGVGTPGAAVEPSAAPAAPATGAAWSGPYQLRGQIEGGRSVAGTLTLAPLDAGAAEYAAASTRVRQTYPSYAGPYYTARMELAASADTLRGTFSCAHGPASPPPLVCHPTTPLTGLENATLVMQPGGRAVLTGSHGEGVSVEFGRLSWTASGG